MGSANGSRYRVLSQLQSHQSHHSVQLSTGREGRYKFRMQAVKWVVAKLQGDKTTSFCRKMSGREVARRYIGIPVFHGTLLPMEFRTPPRFLKFVVFLESVSVYPVYGSPRTGLLRTFWEADRVLRSPLRGLCGQGALNCPTRSAFLCTLYTATPERAFCL